MAELKDRLRTDLATAIKARGATTVATLRMALAAISNEEVSGSSSRELTDDEVLEVLGREAKKRREAAEAYDGAGRTELAAQERAEGDVLAGYLPAQLADDELAGLVDDAVAEVTAALGEPPGPRQMGRVMKAATAKVGRRAEGGRVATAVRTALAGQG
ncbi:MAG: GatB/YqeY domain-containing protein [Pseudonocardiaceae bacterium]|nr:GatB/YqeY domain-containing protein [Pseudonocardiaceae bacterium]